jgi:hypothetical protein
LVVREIIAVGVSFIAGTVNGQIVLKQPCNGDGGGGRLEFASADIDSPTRDARQSVQVRYALSESISA